jgi:hypothetical protein
MGATKSPPRGAGSSCQTVKLTVSVAELAAVPEADPVAVPEAALVAASASATGLAMALVAASETGLAMALGPDQAAAAVSEKAAVVGMRRAGALAPTGSLFG